MANKTAPESLYGTDRDLLREIEHKNEILAQLAGEEYTAPGNIPKGGYILKKRVLDAAQKENEILSEIAEGGLQAPEYSLEYDSGTGGLALAKNGQTVSGSTVSLPVYGAPQCATSADDMTDEDSIYVYTGTTTADLTQGDWYYYDTTDEEWKSGGAYNSVAFTTDTTLAVSGAAADEKATGDELTDLKNAFDEITVSNGQLINPETIGIFTGYINGSGVFKSSSSFRTLYYPCKSDTVYTVTENDKTIQRAVSLSSSAPVENGTSTNVGIISSVNPIIKFNSQSFSYICITFYNHNSGDTSVDASLANIKIQEGAQYTEGYKYGGVVPLISYGGLDAAMLAKDVLLSETAEKVDNIYNISSGDNVVDLTTAVEGYYISLSGLQANASHKCLDYAEINPSTSYIVSQEGGNVSQVACVFYDADKIALDYYSPFSSATSPATAKYIRVSCSKTTTKLSVVEGTVALDVPYWKKINNDILIPQKAPRILSNYAASMTTGDSICFDAVDITVELVRPASSSSVIVNTCSTPSCGTIPLE